MGWVLRLVETGVEGQSRSFDVIEISRPDGLGDIANLGLTLAEGKRLLAGVQQGVVATQADDQATLRPDCRSCGRRCHVKDWKLRRIATLFGEVRVPLPRFLCAGCGRTATGLSWPSRRRSTPELDQLQARLSALMPYRVAADLLVHVLPIDAGKSPETLRNHTLQVGAQLASAAADRPATAAAAITMSLDSTFIRSHEEGERPLEVRVGNVETAGGGRQVFGAVAKTDTDIAALTRRNLQIVGRTGDTEVTAFTDGCSSLRSILADAGVTKPPILDWFHIAMRLHHTAQAASGLSTDNPDRVLAKAVIVAESSACAGAFGTAGQRMLSAASSGSARSCMSSRMSAPIARGVHRQASCGARCMRSIAISAAKAPGSSTTPSDTGLACVSELRSPKARQTSWSIGE